MDLAFYSTFSHSLVTQEATLAQLQQQVSTGTTVQTPAQGPAAYETATLGNDQVSQLDNDNTTQAAIQVQLGSANDAYSSMTSLFDNVQTVLLQALNGTSNAQNLNALASQVESASSQLLAIGNQTAPNGTYLFGGSRGGVAPFQPNASGSIEYYGDGGASQATIGQAASASTIVNGNVFVSALAGDGYSTVTAASSNTGTGQILQEGVVSASTASAFQQGSAPITLSFAVSGTTTSYTATQNGSQIATGTLSTSNDSAQTVVQLAGMNFEMTGSPADGDSFTISPARPQSAFALLQNIYTTLANAGSTPAQVAQTNQALNQDLAGLAQYQQTVTTAQAQNGVTLEAISSANSGNTAQSTEAQITAENATSANMPTVITALNQNLTALQASMKAFAEVQSLSLFSYL